MQQNKHFTWHDFLLSLTPFFLQIRAAREVILSAGSIGSPHLLLLSGIGQHDHLENFGIPVIHNLPGVGYNLQGCIH